MPANYDPKNVAPLIEFFGQVTGNGETSLRFSFPDNDVDHPGDGTYLPGYLRQHKTKTAALVRYEAAAKGSARLREFEKNSPAGIRYFQD